MDYRLKHARRKYPAGLVVVGPLERQVDSCLEWLAYYADRGAPGDTAKWERLADRYERLTGRSVRAGAPLPDHAGATTAPQHNGGEQ